MQRGLQCADGAATGAGFKDKGGAAAAASNGPAGDEDEDDPLMALTKAGATTRGLQWRGRVVRVRASGVSEPAACFQPPAS